MKIGIINDYPLINSVGGTEKVFCDLANAMVQRGHEVTAVCFDGINGEPRFELDSRVHLVDAGFTPPPLALRKSIIELRVLPILSKKKRQIQRAKLRSICHAIQLNRTRPDLNVDVFISFQIRCTHGLRKVYGDKIPIVTMFHGEPNMYSSEYFVSDIQNSTNQILLPAYEPELLSICPTAEIVVIPNSTPQNTSEARLENPVILNLARVCSAKNQELLIRAFHLLHNDFPDWHVEIWGTTVDKKYPGYIRELIIKLGLSDKVQLKGPTKSPSTELLRSSIFAFPSLQEGFPLALTEAMSLGLPTAGCRECLAVSALIKHEENGLLSANTPEAYAEQLARLMRDQRLRKTLGSTAKLAMQEYSPDKIWTKWEALLYELSQNRP